jgi:hypothetical protein
MDALNAVSTQLARCGSLSLDPMCAVLIADPASLTKLDQLVLCTPERQKLLDIATRVLVNWRATGSADEGEWMKNANAIRLIAAQIVSHNGDVLPTLAVTNLITAGQLETDEQVLLAIIAALGKFVTKDTPASVTDQAVSLLRTLGASPGQPASVQRAAQVMYAQLQPLASASDLTPGHPVINLDITPPSTVSKTKTIAIAAAGIGVVGVVLASLWYVGRTTLGGHDRRRTRSRKRRPRA